MECFHLSEQRFLHICLNKALIEQSSKSWTKFVNKKLPFMGIVNAKELYTLSLEKENNIENVELLRQKISNVISKNINFKMQSNLTFEQRTALKELSQSTESKVYSYDKGTGFAILNSKDVIRKIEE